jgi:hypothetical protein
LQVQILPASKEAVAETAEASEIVSSIPCRRNCFRRGATIEFSLVIYRRVSVQMISSSRSDD